MTVDEAERHIANILAGLEKEHEANVEEIEVKDVEVTRMSDTRRQLLRRVVITLTRRPGTRWTS